VPDADLSKTAGGLRSTNGEGDIGRGTWRGEEVLPSSDGGEWSARWLQESCSGASRLASVRGTDGFEGERLALAGGGGARGGERKEQPVAEAALMIWKIRRRTRKPFRPELTVKSQEGAGLGGKTRPHSAWVGGS